MAGSFQKGIKYAILTNYIVAQNLKNCKQIPNDTILIKNSTKTADFSKGINAQ